MTHREPAYGGKQLGFWVDDLKRSSENPPEQRAAEEAIRRLGPAALPHLVKFVRNDPPNMSLALNDWLRKQSWIKYRFPIRSDRSDQAVEAFQVLGPAARPALRNLSRLMENERTCYAAAKCLVALGTPAVPAFTNALASTNRLIKISALMGLGQVKPAATEALPLIMAKTHDPDRPVAEWALLALNQVTNNAAGASKKRLGEFAEGGIIRGPKDEKKIALEFTGHAFADGGTVILDELARHQAKASFFLTGDFLANPEFEPLIRHIIREGHYLGPHSDKHLLYCPWEGPKKTLVTRQQFTSDLESNLQKIQRFGIQRGQIQYWLPAYEWYNQEIVNWSAQAGLTLVNYTPGTRSNADYLEDGAKNFISSQAILDSILKKAHEDPNGLNGFLLLLHIGTGPARTDKMHGYLGKMLDDLSGQGYRFVRIDDLLQSK
ncbi:MAG: Polysaccharide deacetylase [Pedosphaera sp.]|nr:Polysaccharide deacetylase [Pedosphaera sp.]